MKNYLLTALMMVAAMLGVCSCSNDDNNVIDVPSATGKAVSIEVSTKPTTRTVYTDNGTDLKAKFEKGKDYISIFFRRGTSNIGGGTYKLVCTSVNEETGSAVFTSEGDQTLTDDVLRRVMASNSGLTDIHMILASEGSKPDFYTSYDNDLSSQDGTLSDAVAHMQRVTNHNMTNSDNYEWDASTGHLKLKNVDFNSNPELCTSILKIKATFPAGTEVVVGDTPIDLYARGAYPSYRCSWGNASNVTPSDGITPFTQTRVAAVEDNADSTKTATSYVCFWPTTQSPLTKFTVSSNLGNDVFSAEYTVKHVNDDGNSTLKGAKMYTLAVTLAGTRTINRWVGDDPSTIDIGGGTLVKSNADWLTLANGSIKVAANITGAPRTESITISNSGINTVYQISQLSPKDLCGTWDLYSQCFNPNGTLTGKAKGTIRADRSTLTFAPLPDASALEDDNGVMHTNNVNVKGLYLNTVMPACVEIDYDNQTVRLGLFFDRRTVQATSAGTYMAYEPELSERQWAGYHFAPASFGKNNYCWLWFNVTNAFERAEYIYFSNPQYVLMGTKNPMICGISCVKATANDPSTLTVGTTSGYDVIYQANYNRSNTAGMYFVKTANVDPTTVGGDGLSTGGYTEK